MLRALTKKESKMNRNVNIRGAYEREISNYNINIDSVQLRIQEYFRESLLKLFDEVLILKDIDEKFYDVAGLSKHKDKRNYHSKFVARGILNGVSVKIFKNQNEHQSDYLTIDIYGLYQYKRDGSRNERSKGKQMVLDKLLEASISYQVRSYDCCFDSNTTIPELIFKSDNLLAFTNPNRQTKKRYLFEDGEPIEHLDDVETVYLQKKQKKKPKISIVVYDKTKKNDLDVPIVRVEATMIFKIDVESTVRCSEDLYQILLSHCLKKLRFVG